MTETNNKFPEHPHFFPAVADSMRLLVGCRREDYSASRIARAVEDCNAHLLNLNITDMGGADSDGGDLSARYPVLVDLRVGLRNIASVSRSLERYGYAVLDAAGSDGADATDDTTRSRIDSLIRYLEI